MRRNLTTMIAAALALFAYSCGSDFAAADGPADTGSVTFRINIGAEVDVADAASRAADGDTKITSLHWMIADAAGERIDPMHSSMTDDFGVLTIEGLKFGDYSIVFLACSEAGPHAEVDEAAALGDVWLANGAKDGALNGEWFFRRLDLHIDRSQSAAEHDVTLERCVGRVAVDLNMHSEYVERFVDRVSVTFDDAAGVYSAMTADGAFTAPAAIRDEDVTGSRSFLSFPSAGPLSGSVRVDAHLSDGTEYGRTYKFSDCKVEAGRVTRIAVDYRHPEDEDGMIYIGEDDFARFGADTMFMADEPREVFYDNTRRWFYPDEPLQAAIDENNNLRMRFYSPVPVRNVTVRCRFNRVSAEYFDIAHFDLVYPFMEASFPLPVTRGERSFAVSDGSGRRANIPAQPELTDDDVTLEIVCDDEFMRKVSIIDSHWLVYYSPFQADEGHAYWRHMTPELCRHGVALALNMAYMFATEEFDDALEAYRGRMYLDRTLENPDVPSNIVDIDEVRRQLRQHPGLTLGLVTGVGGLGGGRTYGLADYCYRQVYWDWDTKPEANPHTYVRQAMFHEYGHCLGYYSHDCDMTYGDKWTVLCAGVYVRLGREGKLPVCSKNIIAELPM